MTPKGTYKCSRAGCHNAANCKVFWRNPKIHSQERSKTWLACSDHLQFLIDYLDTRGFYIGTEKI